MPNPFNELLAGLAGGFTGYGQQQQVNATNARQATLDRSLMEDRASQNALRSAQAAQDKAKADQDAYLRTPQFQQVFQSARGGDEGAIAHVASAVAGHPDATTFLNAIAKPKPDVKIERVPVITPGATTPTLAYRHPNGTLTDDNYNVIEGAQPYNPEDKGKSQAEIPGTPAWQEAERFKAGLAQPKMANFLDGQGAVHFVSEQEGARQGWTKQQGGTGSSSSSGALTSAADMKDRLADLRDGFAYFSAGAGKGKVQPSWQTAEGLTSRIDKAQANQTTDVKGNIIQGVSRALSLTPKPSDPDYQRYTRLMQAAKFIGNEAAQAAKGRTNQDRVKSDIQFAMPTPADFNDPQKLADKLRLFEHYTQLAQVTQPNTENLGGGRGGGGRGAGGATQQQKDWDEAAAGYRAQGKDPVKEIGPRP